MRLHIYNEKNVYINYIIGVIELGGGSNATITDGISFTIIHKRTFPVNVHLRI